jgi:predicted nuclease of predicted toxin-antitoxin system
MNILVDENIPFMTVKVLREMGHDVKDVRKTSDQGIFDEEFWEVAQQEERLLITTDKGFS